MLAFQEVLHVVVHFSVLWMEKGENAEVASADNTPLCIFYFKTNALNL